MGRPKKQDGEVRKLDVRLTPDNQLPIEFGSRSGITSDDFIKALVCEEGGEGTDKKLHYHAYFETRRSETWMTGWLKRLTGGSGNKFYSQRQAHEGTLGYCVKDEKIVFSLGFSEGEITELVNQSRQYRKDNETDKKRRQRAKENFLGEYMKEVAEALESVATPTPHLCMRLLIDCYARDEKRFPPRSSLETATMSILYKFNKDLVIDWYSKNLDNTYLSNMNNHGDGWGGRR